ncbi:MAG: GvpL/GvpF family gas vesicle protein [Anaerolineales bacterium]|nr:GvpL/GvpF family gas vesicle protein [Anaerolineales bacterium]
MKVVYGITPTKQVPAAGIAVSGLAGQGLEVVAHNGIAAIVSDAPPFDYASLPKQQLVKVLSQHQYTTEQIMRVTATLLPVKFGTLLNRRDVEKMLAQACPDFTQALDNLKGNIEVELIVIWDPQRVFVELAQTPEIAELLSLAPGLPPEQVQQLQIAVGVRVKQLLDARREQIAQIVQGALSELATDVEANAIVNDQVVANFAFLLPEANQSEFERRVESLDEQFGGNLTFKVVGPLPPYSFGTVEIEHLLPEDIAWAREILGLSFAATGEQIRAGLLAASATGASG